MRLLTAPGLSGVAVLGFDGFDQSERAAVAACLRTPQGQPFVARVPHVPQLCTLHLAGEVVDEVLFVDRGERGFELHLHGSPAVIDAMRAAFPGDGQVVPDVSGRAGGAGTAAERLLRTALSVEQLDLALEQQAFEQNTNFAAWLDGIARLENPAREQALATARERSRIALAHLEPCRLVLAGAQNAGKSTLCNRLLLRERVLTGPLPGLTRDPVREVTTLAGYPYELADTAGEGVMGSAVDARALEAGRRLRRGAIVVLVIDASRGPGPADQAVFAAADRVLVLANKKDLFAAEVPWPLELPCDVRVSATTGDAAELRRELGARLTALRALPPAGPVGGRAVLDRGELCRLHLSGAE